MLSMWKVCAVSAAIAVMGFTNVVKAQVRIDASGATFPAPLYAAWVEAYKKEKPGVAINYQAIGSGGGISAITAQTVQFAASDAPMTPAQMDALPKIGAAPAKVMHLPTVAGPAVLIYNVPGLKKLKLNGEVISGVFMGQVKKWNDAKITALNPGEALPNSPIVSVHRSDGSGTTFIFTDYLSKVNPEWAQKIGNATAVQWPGGQAQKGSDGIAAAVKGAEGTIGYVEYAYAVKNKIPFATLLNKDGKEIEASVESVDAAAKSSLTSFPDDMKVSIVNAGGEGSYPICGFTYLLVYEDCSFIKDKEKAAEMLNFIMWCETKGQAMAAGLGYSALPKDAQDKVVAKLKTVKFNGEMLLK